MGLKLDCAAVVVVVVEYAVIVTRLKEHCSHYTARDGSKVRCGGCCCCC